MDSHKNNYSNREIDEKFLYLDQKLIARLDTQDKALGNILAQATKTNGRMTKAEAWLFAGRIAVGIFAFIVIPLCVYIFTSEVKVVNHLQQITK